MKSRADCEDVRKRTIGEVRKGKRFIQSWWVAPIQTRKGYSTLYVNDIYEFPRKQVEWIGKHHIMYRPERGIAFLTAAASSTNPEYTIACYEEVMKEWMGSLESSNVWNKNRNANAESLVRSIQLFSNMCGWRSSFKPLVAYPVYSIFLNESARRRNRLICDGHALLGFTWLSCTLKQLGEGTGADYEICQYKTYISEDGLVGELLSGYRRSNVERTKDEISTRK